MDNPEVAKALHWLGWLNFAKTTGGVLVVLGVALELAGDWFSAPFTKTVDDARAAEMGRLSAVAETARRDGAEAQKNAEEARKEAASYAARIADSEARSAEASARAAEANEKAEREHLARVKIEQRLAPRSLSLEHQRSLIARLSPFAGERFWVITETNDRDPGSEQVRFSEQLSAILAGAGWIKETYSRWTITKAPLPVFRGVSTRGIEVGYPASNADALKVAQALASELAAANVESVVVPFADLSAGIVINVGLR